MSSFQLRLDEAQEVEARELRERLHQEYEMLLAYQSKVRIHAENQRNVEKRQLEEKVSLRRALLESKVSCLLSKELFLVLRLFRFLNWTNVLVSSLLNKSGFLLEFLKLFRYDRWKKKLSNFGGRSLSAYVSSMVVRLKT